MSTKAPLPLVERFVWRVILLALTTFGATGCSSDVANRYYVSQRFPRRSVEAVQLLKDEPKQPFEVIADLQGRNETPEDLRKQAADIGADAVIVTPIGGTSFTSEEWADQRIFHEQFDHIIGTAIRFK